MSTIIEPTAGTFDPQISSDTIWRGIHPDRSLTVDLDNMDEDIADLQEATEALETAMDGKAPTNHSHPGYASSDHSHTGYAASSHSHEQSEISGLIASLAAKANETHDHTLAQIVGLVSALAAKADLIDGKVPESQLPSYVDDVVEAATMSGFPTTGESGKIYLAKDTNKSYRWGGTAYVELTSGVALGETSATAYRGDRGKTAYDHSQNGDVHVTVAKKTEWDGKAAGDHTHTPASIGAAASGHGHSYNDLSDKPTIPTIPASLPANGGNADTVDNKHASDFATAGHTHSAAALISMASALFATGEGGGVNHSYTSGNVLQAISAYPQGIHTVYAAAGCSTNPDSSESFRYLIHKTGTTIGWILAWGSEGSLYTNYQYGDNQFKGWRCLYDASPAPLWSGGANGGYFMTEGHTITPSKKLSECRNGWILLWSDYDTGANAQANNTDFCTTIIPKRAYTGQVWNGAMWYCDVPTYAAGTATDSETRAIKVLQVYDAKLVGTANNAAAPRNDVVLRAIYEF